MKLLKKKYSLVLGKITNSSLAYDKVKEKIKPILKDNPKIANESYDNLLFLLQRYKFIQEMKARLSTIYSEKVSLDNPEHKELLLDIWKKFHPSIEVELKDKKWVDLMGFQGSDPSTDFRGTGVLGLKNLNHFSLIDLRASYTFSVATAIDTWYFYAATGINITGKVIDFIESGNADEYFYSHYKDCDILDFTNKLYGDFFNGFNALWVKEGHKDFMQVNTVLERFMNTEAKEIFLKKYQNIEKKTKLF